MTAVGVEAWVAVGTVDYVSPPYQPSTAGKVVRGTGRTVLAMVSATVLAVTGYAYANAWQLSNGIATTHVFDNGPAQALSGGGLIVPPLTTDQNILLVGMDSRTDAHGNPLPANLFDMLHAGPDTGELNTDTMILVHIPAGGGQAVAFSFPRDSYVQLAGGYGRGRLNSAFADAYDTEANTLRALGVTDNATIDTQAKEAGRKNLIATIEQLLGDTITINRYAEINLYGFYQLSQAVGGIQVCLRQPTYDDETHAHFPAGVQTISGVSALDFVRQRHGLPGGDLDRIVRQQVFLGALADKMLTAGVLTDPQRIQDVISAVQNAVTISDGWDILTFAEQMQSLAAGHITFLTVPTEGNIVVGGADMLQMEPSVWQDFIRAHLNAGDLSTATGTSTATSGTQPGAANTSTGDTAPGIIIGTATGTSTASGTGSGVPSSDQPISGNGVPCVN